MSLEIVKATASVADELGLIHSLSWQHAYRDIVSQEILAGFTPELRAEVFRNAIPAGILEYYLFRVEDKPAGMAILGSPYEEGFPAQTGEIHALYFLPRYWGKGYSSPAMEFCLNRLRELGYAQVILWVLEDNARARRFYEKSGFLLEGRQKVITIGKPLVELCYAVPLA